jgi:hypothetical protein
MGDGANGRKIPGSSAEQTTEQSINAPLEVPTSMDERSLSLSAAAGSIALESAFENLRQTVCPTEAMKSIIEQLTTSFMGHSATVNSLNLARYKKQLIRVASPDEFARNLKTWLNEEDLDYADQALEADGKLVFTLVATPNIVANPHALKDAIKAFDPNIPNDIPKDPYVDHLLYDKYSGLLLSGTNPSNGKATQFSLMPSRSNNSLHGTVVNQREHLDILQKSKPNLRVPSVLEAFAYWQTLYAQGKLSKTDAETYDLTYIRHFDLIEQQIDGLLFVPDSYVNKDGRPRVSGSNARDEAEARLSIG